MTLSKMYARVRTSAVSRSSSEREILRERGGSLRTRGALLLACVGILLLASCKSSGTAITITILPSATPSVDEGQPFNFTANLDGDTANKGVKWTLSNSSTTTTATCSGVPACGTLSNMTPFSVTYTAPINLGATETVTLTATAIANTGETATATINVELPPTFTTAALPQCAVNVFCLPNGANGVPYNQTIVASGGIGTLIFTAPANSLPKGLTLNTTGTIVGTPSLPTVGQQATTTIFTVTATDSPTLGTPATVQQEFSITVTPPPLLSITTNSPLAAGFINATYNAPMSASGGVTPLTWTISSGSLPPGVSLNPTSGQITGVPTLQAVTYPATYPFTVQVQDSSLPTQTKTQSFSITIQKPGPLQITAGVLPQGTTAAPYAPTSLGVTGGVAPYTWTLVGGQLPAGISLSSSGVISGTPIVATSPPTTSIFQVQVTDSEATPVTAGPQSFGITVVGGTNNNSLINGQYSFLFNGYDVNGSVIIAGTLTTDGNGNITTGSEDINRMPPANTSPSPTTVQNANITGTYSLDNTGDGRGTMETIVTNPSTSVTLTTDYRITIDSKGNIHFFETPPPPPTTGGDTLSTHGQGVMRPIPGSTSTGFTGFESTSFTGNYAFEFAGTDMSGKPAALAGEFHADGSSTISQGTGDFNDAGTVSTLPFPISGSLSMSAAGIRGASQFVFAPTGKPQVELAFAYYFVSPNDLFFIELDQSQTPQQTAFYRLSGEAIFQQTGVQFVNSTLKGGSVVTGAGLNSSGNADALAGLITSAAGDGNATLIYDEDNGGAVSSVTTAIGGTYSVAGSGRVAFTFPGWTGHPATVAYLYGPSKGFLLGSDSVVTTGLIEPQSGGLAFSAATVQGSYAVSNALSSDSKASNVVGQADSNGTNSITGAVDEMDANLPLTQHLNQQLAGANINSISSTTGRGTVTFPSLTGFPTTAAFYVVSTGSVRFISTDSGSQHPEPIFFDH